MTIQASHASITVEPTSASVIPGGVAVLAGAGAVTVTAASAQVYIGPYGTPGRIAITCLPLGEIELEFIPVRWLNGF